MRCGHGNDPIHASERKHAPHLSGRREGDRDDVPCVAGANPGTDHHLQADRVDEPQPGQVHDYVAGAARLGVQQPIAKVLVAARVTCARNQYDCCVAPSLEPYVERLVEEVVRSDGASPWLAVGANLTEADEASSRRSAAHQPCKEQ
jgi:hypothetical protein